MAYQEQRSEEHAELAPAASPAPQEHAPVEQWIAQLTSRDAAVRAASERRIQEAGPAAIEALVSTLERENRKKRARFIVGMIAGIALVSLLASAIASLIGGHLQVQVAAYFYVGAAGFGAAVAPTKLQKAVARLLSQQNDLRAVGPLSEALDRQDDATKKLAAGALTRLLPALKASDAGLLAPHQRKVLWGALLKMHDAALARGILHAAIQTGDESALSYVEKLAAGKGAARRDRGLRDEASAILPALRNRVEEENARAVLLRPANAPGAETLLRPAAGTSGVDPDVLLRAADVGEPGS